VGFDDDNGVEEPDLHAGLHWTPLYSWGTPHQEEDERRRRRPRGCLLSAVVLPFVLVAAGVLAAVLSSPPSVQAPPTSTPTSTATPAAGAPANTAALAEHAQGGLVEIDVEDSYQAVEGAGTGMVLTPTGEVLTNNHVIEGETSVTARDVGNGHTYQGKVLGYDRSEDVAVVQLVGASNLQTVVPGDSSKVSVGDGVVAVGNAEGKGGTPSHVGGEITAIDQSIEAQDEINGTTEQLVGLFQTNADIVPGDSGGAMVDEADQVIGMVAAGSAGFEFGGSETSAGFAIPIDTVLAAADAIVAGKRSDTVHIGATAFLGVQVENPETGSGALIAAVVPGGPADRAGLGQGDTVTAVDGTPTTSPETLTDVLLDFPPGTKVFVEYRDSSGRAHLANVTLGSGPPQ
jgi:S1-C subfamily serine protease